VLVSGAPLNLKERRVFARGSSSPARAPAAIQNGARRRDAPCAPLIRRFTTASRALWKYYFDDALLSPFEAWWSLHSCFETIEQAAKGHANTVPDGTTSVSLRESSFRSSCRRLRRARTSGKHQRDRPRVAGAPAGVAACTNSRLVPASSRPYLKGPKGGQHD
jgi:hypothetical protein